jgi:hypothetical protein
MSSKTWYTALTGLLFLILVIIGIALSSGDVDATQDSVAEIVKHYRDDETQIIISLIIEAIAAAVLVWYALHLTYALRESVASRLIYIGAAIVATGLAIDASLSFALVFAINDSDVTIAPAAIQAIALIYNNDFVPFIVGGSIFALSAGIATIQTGVLPKWLGWIAVILGVLAFAGPAGFIALILLIIWIAVTSVMLAMQVKNGGRRADTPAIPGAS